MANTYVYLPCLIVLLGPHLSVGKVTQVPHGLDTDGCDFYVHYEDGNDNDDGVDSLYPMKTLDCAIDPNCNNGLFQNAMICLYPGEIEIYDVIRPKSSLSTIIKSMEDGGVTFDGLDQTQIFNTGRTPMTFVGLHFDKAHGTSGGAVYGEARMEFHNCTFTNNVADIDGGAVMVSRDALFENCQFSGNKAKYGGAVRVSDIGSATFSACNFEFNSATEKGGALVTQIENPEKHAVTISDSLFCFNTAPLGSTVYDFRDAKYTCGKYCLIDTKDCCSGVGTVVPNPKHGEQCKCDEGYAGPYCGLDESADTVDPYDEYFADDDLGAPDEWHIDPAPTGHHPPSPATHSEL
eukprot:m.161868 g.161868  ORF g.161868 m.161868 type:complete len:349 (+) comp18059_c0_seq1:305-1351(+)